MNSDDIINSIIKPFVVEQPYEIPGEFYMSSNNTNQTTVAAFEEELKCKHEECPYKACQWHKYTLMEIDRNNYANRYSGVASMFPLIIEDMKKCKMYLDI